jgi:hypothetical protein
MTHTLVLNYVSNQGCAGLQVSDLKSLQRIRNLHGDGDRPQLSNNTVARQTLLALGDKLETVVKCLQ